MAIYFVLAFALSWGAVLVAMATGDGAAAFSITLAGMALGPPVAGLLMTALVEGRAGLERLGRGLVDLRRIARRESLVALAAPASALAVLLAFAGLDAAFSPKLLTDPNPLSLIAMGLVGGFAIGALEETGWTGFATHRLLPNFSALTAGAAIGVLHAVWHVLAGYIGESQIYGGLFPVYFLIAWIGGLTVLRILMTWAYARTGSLLLAALIHGGYTGGLLMLWPAETSAVQNIVWTACFVGVLAAITAVTVAFGRNNAGEDRNPDGRRG